jgi:hypothetical protein
MCGVDSFDSEQGPVGALGKIAEHSSSIKGRGFLNLLAFLSQLSLLHCACNRLSNIKGMNHTYA